MTYQIIQPPFTLEFSKMPKDALKAYYKWFRDQIPVRVGEIAKAVRASPTFSSWEPDFTPDSLVPLGAWLAEGITTRARTSEEIQELETDKPYPIQIPDHILTNRSYSLAVDVGMYLSQVLLKNHPALLWHHPLEDKRDADYGQPVLVGAGPTPLNPVMVVLTLTFGLADRTRSPARLRELYEIWKDLLVRGKAPAPPPRRS